MQPRKGGNKTRRKEKGVGTAIVAIVVILIAVAAAGVYFLARGGDEGGAGGGQGYPSEPQTALYLTDDQGQTVSASRVLVDGVDRGSGGSISLTGLDLGSHTVIIYIGDAQFTKSFYFSGQATVTVQLKSRITLNASDIETGVAIDTIDVYADGTYKGKLTQDGQLDITNIAPGRHRVGLDVPGAQGMVERYVTVGEEDQVSLSIDMPNPSFVTTVSVTSKYGLLDQRMDIKVTLKNMGDVSSQDTTAIIFVYHGDDLETVKDSAMLDFGNLASGGLSADQEATNLDSDYWHRNRIFVVVVDRWKYTPQNGTVAAEVSTSESQLTQLARWAGQYLEQHPEIVGKIASMFLSKLV